eukprot:1314997-Amorphochlora_amoeboformis.AAC.1
MTEEVRVVLGGPEFRWDLGRIYDIRLCLGGNFGTMSLKESRASAPVRSGQVPTGRMGRPGGYPFAIPSNVSDVRFEMTCFVFFGPIEEKTLYIRGQKAQVTKVDYPLVYWLNIQAQSGHEILIRSRISQITFPVTFSRKHLPNFTVFEGERSEKHRSFEFDKDMFK